MHALVTHVHLASIGLRPSPVTHSLIVVVRLLAVLSDASLSLGRLAKLMQEIGSQLVFSLLEFLFGDAFLVEDGDV